MQSRLSVIALASLLSSPIASAEGMDRRLASSGAEPFAETLLFSFHSDPKVCLHHFLYRWARKEAMAAGEIPKRYPEPTLRDVDLQVVSSLSAAEQAAWEKARTHYRQHVVSRSLLFDDGLIALRDTLAGSREGLDLTEADRQALAQVEAAREVYERRWWPRHDAENREWVAAVIGDVVRFERQIAQRIEGFYGTKWPSPPNRVDLVPYASSTVAYTTSEPHTMIAADDAESRHPWALELLFHEASHSHALEGHLDQLLEAAYEGRDQEPPRNLWHILLFSIAGEATQQVLVEAGREGYVPMAEEFQIFRRRETDRQAWEVLGRIWYPAMAQGTTLEAALPAIVEAFD